MEGLEAELARLQGQADAAVAKLEAERSAQSATDQTKGSEVSRLTEDLRKCEETLAQAETEMERLHMQVAESKKAVRSFDLLSTVPITSLAS